jgi:hypothetical protein
MPDKKKKEKGIIEKIKDAISTREDPDDPKSRVGSGGKTRRQTIDDAIERMQTGQSTDSNQ